MRKRMYHNHQSVTDILCVCPDGFCVSWRSFKSNKSMNAPFYCNKNEIANFYCMIVVETVLKYPLAHINPQENSFQVQVSSVNSYSFSSVVDGRNL